jgi:Ca-activated chloride channel family protein
MKFTHPLLLLAIVPFLGLEAYLFYRLKSRSISLATLSFISPKETWRLKAVRWLRFLPIFSIVFLIGALAKPTRLQNVEEILPSGIDVVIALDISGSMAAEDFQPLNRLAVAKKVIAKFISERPSDRIGLILFAGKAVTRSPITLDHQPLLKTLEFVSLGMLPEGTAIGTALISGVNRLQRNVAESGDQKGDRILVLITDGRNNAGEIHPLDALRIVVAQKIKTYTIGVGSYGRVPFPIVTPEGKKSYRYEQADVDETLLRQIADRTSAQYFRADDAQALQHLFDRINVLEKSRPATLKITTIRDWGMLFIVPALVLGLCYAASSIIIIRYP